MKSTIVAVVFILIVVLIIHVGIFPLIGYTPDLFTTILLSLPIGFVATHVGEAFD